MLLMQKWEKEKEFNLEQGEKYYCTSSTFTAKGKCDNQKKERKETEKRQQFLALSKRMIDISKNDFNMAEDHVLAIQFLYNFFKVLFL